MVGWQYYVESAMESSCCTIYAKRQRAPDKVDVQNNTSSNGEGRHVRCFVGRKFNGPSGSMQFAPRVLIQ